MVVYAARYTGHCTSGRKTCTKLQLYTQWPESNFPFLNRFLLSDYADMSIEPEQQMLVESEGVVGTGLNTGAYRAPHQPRAVLGIEPQDTWLGSAPGNAYISIPLYSP